MLLVLSKRIRGFRRELQILKKCASTCDRLLRYSKIISLVLMLQTALLLAYDHTFVSAERASASHLRDRVRELSGELESLRQENAVSGVALDQYTESVGYIYGVYHVGFEHRIPEVRARVSGTGFLIHGGLIVTNRHVANPWYGDAEAEKLIQNGATATLEDLFAFFPGSPTAVRLSCLSVSKISDLAVLQAVDSKSIRNLPALHLAGSPPLRGEPVILMGYPFGIRGMLAKFDSGIRSKMEDRHGDFNAALALADRGLIRPSTTFGHLGDVVGDTLVYDASTAHGGSGGPILDSKGEVIGINYAYTEGFAGGGMGVSVECLLRLLREAPNQIRR